MPLFSSEPCSSSSSSSSVPTRGWKYDVFLSFRGEDTRRTFVDHLYAALIQRGIHVYKDDNMLPRGESICPELMKAIEESRFSVVVLSKNYANSSWCLEELAMIMECRGRMGQKVLPVFYHVAPTDVRTQKRKFATAFQKHEENFKGEMEKVNKWRTALTGAANLKGWHIGESSGYGESSCINDIVDTIFKDLEPSLPSESNLIGIKSRVDKLNSLLRTEANDEVLMVGIYGMGGIGKTTIAQALFGRISIEFEGSCFVNDVREKSSRKDDICAEQNKILQNILKTAHEFKFYYPEQGADMIQTRLCKTKVLLVLDDVDKEEQLEFLAARHEWFGPGSRIIITTRDKHLLSCADRKYKPTLLHEDEALVLFSRHAFRKNGPPDMYKELTSHAVYYTGYLPLALKVLGSFFHGKKAYEWEDALNRLSEAPNDQINNSLKLSYERLEEPEKKLFLNIVCLFIGRKVEDVTIIHDCCGFHSKTGIKILTERSFITISKSRIEMHDLIKEMGLKIVRESSPNSRLSQVEEIHDFISKNSELEAIEAIVAERELYADQLYDEYLSFNADIFRSMKNLTLLDVESKFTSHQPTLLPNKLTWFSWCFYPFASLPISHICKLVGLKMKWGNIQYLWKGQQVLSNLKLLHLHEMNFLTSFPDVSRAPNIERLVLSGCNKLVKVHESLGYLKKLKHLDISDCSSLERLPPRFEMESLKTLIISRCESLRRIPEFLSCMDKLLHIDLSHCLKIEELPTSIGCLSGLSSLNLSSCTSLKIIPNSISELKSIKSICLDYCWRLQILPKEFGSIENLEELQLGSMKGFNPFERLPESINLRTLMNLCSLRKLDLIHRQIRDKDFPENLHEFSCLEELRLSGNLQLIQLPAGISHLSCLKQLMLDNCRNLQNLDGLPSRIEVLEASDCSSLERIKDLLKEHELLNKISLRGCQKLLRDEENERYLDKMLQQSFLKKCAVAERCLSITIPGSKIPSWVKEQQHGGEMALKLPLEQQTTIIGFVVCGVFGQSEYCNRPCIDFISEYDGMEHVGGSFAPADENGNVYIGYVPFSLFQQQTDDDNDGLPSEDWSDIIQGNFVVRLNLNNHIRCSGVYAVYKEDVGSHQEIKPSSSCWNWKPVFSSWIWTPAGWSKCMKASFKDDL